MVITDVINANTRNKSKTRRVMEVKRYYLSMYRCYMIKLYDMGYIADPTRFNKNLILKNIMDMGINDLFNYSGKIELTSDHTLFAYYKNKNDYEKAEFLKVLYNVLKYREYSQTVDILYEEYEFQGKSSNYIRYNMCLRGAMVIQRSGINFNEAIARCVSRFEEDTKWVDINDKLWSLAMKELGVPESEWLDDGLLDSTLSHKEEVECIEGILNGYFKVSGGRYTKLYQDWMLAHRWNINSVHKLDTQGLFDYLFGAYVREVENALNDKLNKIDGCCVVAVNKNKIYYNVERENLEMPFGIFSVVCDTGIEEYLLPDLNLLNGYTGELYTEDRLLADGIDFVGCPILMNINSEEERVFYDLEQTNLQSESWFNSDDDLSIDFDENALSAELNPFNKGTGFHQMYEGYVNSLRSPDGLINVINVKTSKDLERYKKSVSRHIKE